MAGKQLPVFLCVYFFSGWHSYCFSIGMSHLDLKIPHSLPQEEALRRIKKLLKGLQQQHSQSFKEIDEHWDGYEGRFSFSANGFSVAGKIYVGADSIRLSSRLPLVLSFYKKKISDVIQEKAGELLVA